MMFSVLMPVFNGSPYLERAVRSVTAQTEPDWELIIVDDGSTDGAAEALVVADPRIRILRQNHQGAPSAANAALQHARGRFIAILDQDDLWAPAKLRRHAEAFARSTDVDFSFTWSHYIGPDDERLPLPPRQWRGRVSFDLLVRDFVVGNTSSVAFRRESVEAVGGFNVELPRMYDLELVLRVAALRPDNGMAIEEDLCAYRRHPLQMSRNWYAMRQDWERLIDGRLPGLSDDTRREAQRNMTRYFSLLAYESGDLGSAARLLWESIRAQPLAGAIDTRSWKLAAAIAATSAVPDAALRGRKRHE